MSLCSQFKYLSTISLNFFNDFKTVFYLLVCFYFANVKTASERLGKRFKATLLLADLGLKICLIARFVHFIFLVYLYCSKNDHLSVAQRSMQAKRK